MTLDLTRFEHPTPFNRMEILGRLRVVGRGELTKLERKLIAEIRRLESENEDHPQSDGLSQGP